MKNIRFSKCLSILFWGLRIHSRIKNMMWASEKKRRGTTVEFTKEDPWVPQGAHEGPPWVPVGDQWIPKSPPRVLRGPMGDAT